MECGNSPRHKPATVHGTVFLTNLTFFLSLIVLKLLQNAIVKLLSLI